MNTILLILCNALSCFIISTILFQFMNGKYERSSQNRYVYIVVETVTVIFTTCINMLNHSILNLVVWGVLTVYPYPHNTEHMLLSPSTRPRPPDLIWND